MSSIILFFEVIRLVSTTQRMFNLAQESEMAGLARPFCVPYHDAWLSRYLWSDRPEKIADKQGRRAAMSLLLLFVQSLYSSNSKVQSWPELLS